MNHLYPVLIWGPEQIWGPGFWEKPKRSWPKIVGGSYGLSHQMSGRQRRLAGLDWIELDGS